MRARKRSRKILTYDDVLLRLRETLADPDRGPVACARLRERFDVVLVDEFQDTDPVQWEIMARAFGEGSSTTLVLIGDPKQAIYAFRGADVHAYLLAHQAVQSEWTLDVNWRSDQALLEAYDALFGDAHLGYADIAYRPVRAAEANQAAAARRCAGLGAPPAADRCTSTTASSRSHPSKACVNKAEARNAIAADLAADVVSLLSARPTLIARRRDGRELEHVEVHPGHIAVLVRLNSHAALVRDALHAASVPAVIGGAGSVFATEPAQEWLRLLEALERPTARDRASLAALTCFVGWIGERGGGGVGGGVGGPALVPAPLGGAATRSGDRRAVREGEQLAGPCRGALLTRASGERFMTDLRHVAQLLHEAGVSRGARPDRAGHLAGPAYPRRRARRGERGTGPPARVRRRRRPGDHHPPQQGSRVPHRLLPLRMGWLRQAPRRPDVPRPR